MCSNYISHVYHQIPMISPNNGFLVKSPLLVCPLDFRLSHSPLNLLHGAPVITCFDHRIHLDLVSVHQPVAIPRKVGAWRGPPLAVPGAPSRRAARRAARRATARGAAGAAPRGAAECVRIAGEVQQMWKTIAMAHCKSSSSSMIYL